MSQPPVTAIDCFQQSFYQCLGLFKRSGTATQAQCNTSTKFSPLNEQSSKMQSEKSNVLCMCCKGEAEQTNDSESTPIKQVVTAQPQKNFDTFDSHKINNETDVQNIVDDTNPEKLNMDYSSYLSSSKDEAIFKTKDAYDGQMERNLILNTKNNNKTITSTSDISVSLKAEEHNNKNNSCLSSSDDHDVTGLNNPCIKNNNKISQSKSSESNSIDRVSHPTDQKEILSKGKMDEKCDVKKSSQQSTIKHFNGHILQDSVNEMKNAEIEAKEEHNTTYFRNLTAENSNQLNALCLKWEELLRETCGIPEEVQNEIRSVIGQTRLVISERFTQFLSLVDRADGLPSIKGNEENLKPINNSDLQGFWDMIYFQVEDVHIKFKRLNVAKDQQWSLEQPKAANKPKIVTKKKPVAKKMTKNPKVVSEAEKARREAARRRVLEARKNMALRKKQVNNTSEENGDVLIL